MSGLVAVNTMRRIFDQKRALEAFTVHHNAGAREQCVSFFIKCSLLCSKSMARHVLED